MRDIYICMYTYLKRAMRAACRSTVCDVYVNLSVYIRMRYIHVCDIYTYIYTYVKRAMRAACRSTVCDVYVNISVYICM